MLKNNKLIRGYIHWWENYRIACIGLTIAIIAFLASFILTILFPHNPKISGTVLYSGLILWFGSFSIQFKHYRQLLSLITLGVFISYLANYVVSSDSQFNYTILGLTIIALGLALHEFGSGGSLEGKINKLDEKISNLIAGGQSLQSLTTLETKIDTIGENVSKLLSRGNGDDKILGIQDEALYPSVDLAYELTKSNYDSMQTRFDAANARLQNLMGWALVLTPAIPVLAKTFNDSINFHSNYFYSIFVIFVIIAALGIGGHRLGGVKLIRPKIVYDNLLHLSHWQFQQTVLYWSVTSFDDNKKTIDNKSFCVDAISVLLFAEIALALAWMFFS